MAKAYSPFLSAKLFTKVGQAALRKRDRILGIGVVNIHICV